MATARWSPSSAGPPAERLRRPRLSRAEAARAERHLADLAGRRRSSPTARLTRAPRLRRVGRRLWVRGVWAREGAVRPWRFIWNPRRPLGRWWAHLRLLAPLQTFNVWKLGLLLLALSTGVLRFWSEHPLGINVVLSFARKGTASTVLGALFTASAIGLLATLWNDLFRCPWLGWRIRRRIRRSPSSVLHAHLGERRIKLVPVKDPLEIVPREKLFDEVLQGILAHDRKDVQIVVGEPGSGKTTALVSLAQTLARIGVLPVVVPLRARQDVGDLVRLAKEQLAEQMEPFVRSTAEGELLWRWLCHRRRVAILVDDIDQIGPDGERGYMLRRSLEEAATRELPIVVTARPAGVPAGIAASSLELESLEDETAAECVEKGARDDPAFSSSTRTSRRMLEDWIHEGDLAEVPFYLELLAHLLAGGAGRKLPGPETARGHHGRTGRYRRTADGGYRWNPLWVRFMLLERFREQAAAGRVRRWIGIEASERHSSLVALEGAALGTLVASGIGAGGASQREEARPGEPPASAAERPRRERIEDFISSRDRELGDLEDGLEAGHGDGRGASRADGDGDQAWVKGERRRQVSAHEVVDTGERLRILDCDSKGDLQFRHRIMQAYLAGCRLAMIEHESVKRSRAAGEEAAPDANGYWIERLLDRRHPEKLTAHMALTFAALGAQVELEAASESDRSGEEKAAWGEVMRRIRDGLLDSARQSLCQDGEPTAEAPEASALVATGGYRGRQPFISLALVPWSEVGPPRGGAGDIADSIDPRRAPDPEDRADPDDALVKLTTAAEIACATGSAIDGAQKIIEKVRNAYFATRWTKLAAIRAIAEMRTPESWECIWEFARDRDYLVRQAASDALEANAFKAFTCLREEIREVILRASVRSERGLVLTQADEPEEGEPKRDRVLATEPDLQPRRTAEDWTKDDVLKLRALAWILPAIVSGLREDPATHAQEAWRGSDTRDSRELERPSHRPVERLGREESGEQNDYTDYERFPYFVRVAGEMLAQLVGLAFQGGQRGLEEALALGFKGDAMRHAHSREGLADSEHRPDSGAGPGSFAGPGWVAGNRRLVLEACLEQAESWYGRLLLHQALALYTIAGAGREEAMDAFARLVHRGRERHPFTQRAARLARAAVRRSRLGVASWHAYVWDDEGPIAGRRQAALNRVTSQLVADVTVLLDLKEGSPDDRREPFGSMQQLPHCLSASRDRAEILGKGCPDSCGWNFCPYKQPPVDEPSAHRGVTRAFCREQQRYARHHRPRWQRDIHRRRLREFWREMEMRART